MGIVKGLEGTFNMVANEYEKIRPGYVDKLYEDIFSYIPLEATSKVVEVGIGGGQATPPILQTGCKLTAVEYGDELAKVCQQKFKDWSNFTVENAKFEDFKCEDNTYDFIYSASAFHWIPEEIGYKKVYQMLKQGGVFARFANHPFKDKGRAKLDEEIQKIYAVYMPRSPREKEYDNEDAKHRANIALKYGFTDITYYLYHRQRTFTAKEYTQLLGTYSDHIAIEEKKRIEFFGKIEQTIEDFGGKITIYDTIDLALARKL